MDAPFPFGFPWPTAMYLTFYVVTGVIYAGFMHYTLAGALVLAVGRARPIARRWFVKDADDDRAGAGILEKLLGDWLPPMLGMAITTGVAPLLFLQILHKKSFYTANLLLFHRFMLFLPVLIVAYYMLYLLKSKRLDSWGPAPKAAAATVGFIFIGWAWTENHMLSLHREVWGAFYGSGRWFYSDYELWPRFGYTVTAAFSTLALAAAWQLVWGRRGYEAAALDLAARQLRFLALIGLAFSAAEAVLWYIWLETPARTVVGSILARPSGVLLFIGIGVQAACWFSVEKARTWPRSDSVSPPPAWRRLFWAPPSRAKPVGSPPST